MEYARGCLLVIDALLIAGLIIDWLGSLSRNAPIMGHVYGTIFIALIVTPLIVVFIKLAKYKPRKQQQNYLPPQTIQPTYTRPYTPPDIAQIVNSFPTQDYWTPKPPIQARVLDSRYIPSDLRRKVLERDNYQCQECGSYSYLELDHIIPLSKGGATSYDNLQVLCRSYNGHKGNR